MKTIPTYIISPKRNIDQQKTCLKEFAGRPEFKHSVVEPVKHRIREISLWETIKYIISDSTHKKEEYIIICEESHRFTEDYSKEYLFNAIDKAAEKKASVLLGGIYKFENALPVTENLWWVEKFNGLQFAVIFQDFFKEILNAEFEDDDFMELKLSQLTNSLFFTHPFISIQEDLNASNNPKEMDHIKEIFKRSSLKLGSLKKVSELYKNNQSNYTIEQGMFNNISIPTYIINLPERTERLNHIKNQFVNKKEFDLTIVEAHKHEIGALGLWLTIRDVIQSAIDNEEEIIIICEDDHEFTEHYSREYLIKNILDAYYENIDFMSGGTSSAGHLVAITENRYWVSSCLATQFIIIYEKFFSQILNHPFDHTVIADQVLSNMTINKMILYPFVSTQKDFGYSDVTPFHNQCQGVVQSMFSASAKKIENFKNALSKIENVSV